MLFVTASLFLVIIFFLEVVCWWLMVVIWMVSSWYSCFLCFFSPSFWNWSSTCFSIQDHCIKFQTVSLVVCCYSEGMIISIFCFGTGIVLCLIFNVIAIIVCWVRGGGKSLCLFYMVFSFLDLLVNENHVHLPSYITLLKHVYMIYCL